MRSFIVKENHIGPAIKRDTLVHTDGQTNKHPVTSDRLEHKQQHKSLHIQYIYQGGRGHWTLNYTCTKSFITEVSYIAVYSAQAK